MNTVEISNLYILTNTLEVNHRTFWLNIDSEFLLFVQ